MHYDWSERSKSTHAVESDKWDLQDFEDARFDVKPLNENVLELGKTKSYVDDAYSDFFQLLYQGDPKMLDKYELKTTHLFNHAIVKGFDSLDDLEKLRLDTRFDQYASAFALLQLKEEIEKLYEENEAAQELTKMLQELISQLEKDPDNKGLQEQYTQTVSDLNDALEDIDMSGIGTAMRQASEELQKQEGAANSFGLEKGDLKRMSFQEREALSKKLKSARMMTFAKMVGQFKMVAKGARRRHVVGLPDEVVNVELGNDFTRLTPFQLSQMAMEETKAKFWLDYVNGELVQNQLRGSERLGSGPIVFIMDESGSMGYETSMGGTREMWGKAFAIALADQARRGRRDFTYIGFSSSYEIYEESFQSGKIPVDRLVKFSEHFFGGGTDPARALKRAKAIIQSYPKDKRPDLVFLTDGEFGRMTPQFLEEWKSLKNDTSMKTFGIGFSTSGRSMEPICDVIIPISDMTADASSMGRIFEEFSQ